jgi:CBS-domain-containing membrane protein
MNITCLNQRGSRMQELTVADVMSRQLTVIPNSASMHDAACIFADNSASCAPVVDDAGVCVGVLSASDFLTFEIDRTGRVVSAHGREVNTPRQGDQLPWNSVRKFMSTALQTVPADATLVQAGEVMCGEHIHRLFVLGKRGEPVGVISTLDVVAALVKASKEKGAAANE